MDKNPNGWQECPEFWANLLGAVANSNIAAASNDVAFGLHQRMVARAERNAEFKALLDEKLGPRKK